MLVYGTIFLVSICGYIHAPILSVGLATIALSSLSYGKHYYLYRRGAELGLYEAIDQSFKASLFNALIASMVAYAVGAFVRMISGL
jgi:hypothetical protein